jgi:hypothetical protein
MHEYRKEILTVYEDDVVIGYMARVSTIFGCSSDVPDGWCVCHGDRCCIGRGM